MAKPRTEAMVAALAAMAAGASMWDAAKAHGVTTRGLHEAAKREGIQRPPRGRPRGRKPAERTDRTRRKNRLQQAAHRGSRRSYKTDAENLGLLLLWEADYLSEGQVARALDVDRVSLRLMREGALSEAMRLAEALLPQPGDSGRGDGGWRTNAKLTAPAEAQRG